MTIFFICQHFFSPPQPETTKVQAIIEKTARFISAQGPQMEILIKAKQANNPLFDFLNQNGRLNAFYKHTLQSMKDGNYPTESDRPENSLPPNNNDTTTGSLYQNYYSANQSMVGETNLSTKLSKKIDFFFSYLIVFFLDKMIGSSTCYQI